MALLVTNGGCSEVVVWEQGRVEVLLLCAGTWW